MLRSSILVVLWMGSFAAAAAPLSPKCDAPSEYAVIEQCGWEENDRTEAEQKAALGRLMAAVGKSRSEVTKLRQSQAAWVSYRNTSCAFWSQRVRYQVPWCRANLNKLRAVELTRMAECQEEGGGKC
jgi:uncharacterized protein YecT (DUF1311 family)